MQYPINNIIILDNSGMPILTAPVTDSAERNAYLMQNNYVKLSWNDVTKRIIPANSFIEYDNQIFYIPDEYTPEWKDGYYNYTVEFHAIEDLLNRPVFFRYVQVTENNVTTEWKESEFSINGNIKMLGDIICVALNRLGFRFNFQLPENNTYNDSLLKSYSFSGESIESALSKVATENETEWWLEYGEIDTGTGIRTVYLHFDECKFGNSISLSDIYSTSSNNQYRSGGLRSVELSNINIIPEKLFVYGSERNITKKSVEQQTEGGKMNVSYDKRLRLPFGVSSETISGRIVTFDGTDSSVTISGISNKYEQVKIFDDVYPKMNMTVTQVNIQNPSSENPIFWLDADRLKSLVVKKDNPFCINPGKHGDLMEGTTLMCTFTSGLLNGFEFECGWSESEARIGIVPSTLDDITIPNDVLRPKIGDTFILWNIKMSNDSIVIAQQELVEETKKYITELLEQNSDITCQSDPEYFRISGASNYIKVGQSIRIQSNTLKGGIVDSRIIQYSYKLTNPYDVKFTVSRGRQQGRLAELENKVEDIKDTITTSTNFQKAISRRQWHDISEMLVMLDNIQKQLVVVGDENNNFTSNITISFDNATKILSVSSGYIQHGSYTENDWGGAWLINTANTFDLTQLDPTNETPYYVYFVCSKNSNSGYSDISNSLPELEDNYVFVAGILSSEYEGKRVFNQSSGLTTIAGGRISTDVISDSGMRLIIDFPNATITARQGATIRGKIEFIDVDGNTQDLSNVINSILVKTGGKKSFFGTGSQSPINEAYNEGDIWFNGEDILVSINSRLKGDFDEADWQKYSTYDNTKTVIDDGLITTGTLAVSSDGSEESVTAGVTATGHSVGFSVRFWAGTDFANRDSAYFRAMHDGSLFATRAYTFLPAFEINDNNIAKYVTSSTILYLDKNSNAVKSYNYSFFNFDLTGSKILINTDKCNISRINMPVNKEYYGATIEIYNPHNKELNFSTNVPDIEFCNTNNYLDRMVTQGYIGAYNSFNQDYYNYPSGVLSLNRGSIYGRVAVLKSVVNAYRFTIRKKIVTPITEYTYLRFRMIRIKLNTDMRNYLGRYYSVNEDGCVYLWICEEKQKEPQLFATNTPSINNKYIGGFK